MNTADQINARALELCPAWQRPNAAIEAWAVAQATAEVLKSSCCDFGNCPDPAVTFVLNYGELRPFCAKHVELDATLRSFADKERARAASSTRAFPRLLDEDGNPVVIPSGPEGA